MTTKTIKDHKISITVGMCFVCFLFVATSAYNLGAEQKEVVITVKHQREAFEDHVAQQQKEKERLEEQRAKDIAEQREVFEAILIMSIDIKNIKKNISEMREAQK